MATSSFLNIDTQYGTIKIRLATEAAPKSCAIISSIAKDGLFDNCCFYRAEPKFVLQGGLKEASGKNRPHPYGKIPLEFKLLNKRGTVTLARWEDPDCATGDFFINLSDSPHLDKTGNAGWKLGFAVFGEVVQGMDVADQMSSLPTQLQGGLKMLTNLVKMKVRLTNA